jgi:amidase
MFAPLLLAAEVHDVVAKTYYDTFYHGHPVLKRIKKGDTVRTRTLDAFAQDKDGAKVAENLVNALTGPFYVEGAEPGDALVVRLDKVRCNRGWGWTNYRLGSFSLLKEYLETAYPNRYKMGLVLPDRENLVPWHIDVEKQTVRLKEPVSSRIRLDFPAKPMPGCIGVAPEGDEAAPARPSGPYGGNLDYNEITEGATVIFPVFHPGGLLFFGDGHALQGDGEPLGTGIETSLDIEFTVDVRKNAHLTGPRMETAEYLISIGSQPEFRSSLDQALRMATVDMVRWLVEDYGLEPWAAHLLIGVEGRYQVVTVAGSMALKIPRRHLPAGTQ